MKRILAVKPSSLGDILHVFPALELLRRKYPEAELDFLVHPAFADILDYSPFPVAHKILFNRKRLGRLPTLVPEFMHLVRELRKQRYDLIIDFQGLTRSAIFAKAAKGGPVVGFAHPREPAARLGYKLKFDVPAGHAVERNVNLVNAFLGTADPVPAPLLPENPENAARLRQLVGVVPEELVALLPGSRWQTKTFPPPLFADVIRRIHAQRPGCVFAIVGAASDSAAAEEIRQAAGPGIPLLELTGKTSLGVMMEILRNARLVISNDSGPMHAAAALRKPVFGFFGPTDPAKTGPYGELHRIYRRRTACLGCLKRSCPEPLPACHRLDAAQIANDCIQTLTTGK
ncbi:MAG: glycosyltransferase family 9 protein [Lentisphaeria bacterium]|nr:glycosyltransferase family 9 protein [Lentisphaeria bacterium]